MLNGVAATRRMRVKPPAAATSRSRGRKPLATAGRVVGAIGAAMVTVALLEGGDAGLHRLRRAVDLLADSPRVLVRIRALIELGAMLRRNRQPAQARRPLTLALDMAHHHGATAELRASLADRSAWQP